MRNIESHTRNLPQASRCVITGKFFLTLFCFAFFLLSFALLPFCLHSELYFFFSFRFAFFPSQVTCFVYNFIIIGMITYTHICWWKPVGQVMHDCTVYHHKYHVCICDSNRTFMSTQLNFFLFLRSLSLRFANSWNSISKSIIIRILPLISIMLLK